MAAEQQQTYENKNANHVITSAIFGEYFWCTRLVAASDKAYQLLTHVRWFSSGTPACSTTKTGRHGIAEISIKYDF